MQEAAARKGFFRELRRRKVFRTVGLYVGDAWLLMQLADVVFPGWGLPDAAINSLSAAAPRADIARIDDAGDFAAKRHKARAVRRASIG
jgi:hypothetical protein